MKKKGVKKLKKKEVDIEIKVKGDDGQVTSYHDDEEDGDEVTKPKAKKGKKKSTKSKIQSEETLEMLMNIMKP